MAQRRLVVASDVGGHRELIRDGKTGKLFAADNLESLVRVILGLLGDYKSWRPMQDAARRYVENERTWENSVARYEPVYEKLLTISRRK